jgi:hypothetical protein
MALVNFGVCYGDLGDTQEAITYYKNKKNKELGEKGVISIEIKVSDYRGKLLGQELSLGPAMIEVSAARSVEDVHGRIESMLAVCVFLGASIRIWTARTRSVSLGAHTHKKNTTNDSHGLGGIS